MADQTIIKIRWEPDDTLFAQIDDLSDKELKELAFAIQAEAQANIVANDQVDTGFLLNSAYVVMQDGVNTYNQARGSGEYLSTRTDQIVQRERTGPGFLPAGTRGLIAFGAIYAIWQELKNSFLYRAAEQVKAK